MHIVLQFAKHVIYTVHVYTCFIVCNLTVYIVLVDILYFYNYKCIMFNATIIVVRQPSGYMELAFHWQYGDILLAIFCLLIITLYCL